MTLGITVRRRIDIPYTLLRREKKTFCFLNTTQVIINILLNISKMPVEERGDQCL
jgi:hypothetical protein